MKFFRYRRPSLKTVLGLTKLKKQLKTDLGITAFLKPFRWWTNQKRWFKRSIGYESTAGKLIRHGLPRPMGCTSVILAVAVITLIGVSCVIASVD